MAFNAKTAGILAGLGVGLFGGIFLAAFNPMIPDQDQTKVADAPKAVTTGEVLPDETPDVTGGADNGGEIATAETPKPQASEPEKTPQTDREISHSVVAGQVDELAEIQTDDDSQIALLAPDDAPEEAAKVGALPEPGSDPAPELSTKPATPLEVDEPASDVATSVADPAQPDVGESPAVKTPTVDPETLTDAPEQIEPTPVEAAALPEVQLNPVVVDEPEPEPEEEPGINTEGTFDTAASRLPTIGSEGGGGFTSRKAGGSGLNLPTIGGAGASEPDTEVAAPPKQKTGALERNAVKFEAPDKPLMSIILMEAGAGGLPAEKLTKLIVPAAFAVQVDGDQPATKARMFQKAGFEVLALSPRSVEMSLSGGQSQAQVDDMLEKIFTLMPEAVGLIDRPSAELQKDRKLAKAVIESFRSSGHGLVTYSKGLNSIPRDASLANVPAVSVFRVLDEKGESASVIARYLNRAALDARRNGHVIVMGTTAPETVTAIVNWSLSAKARAVAFAPVSASMLQTVE
ncbi:MAG: hypothetical protein GY947_07165 [Rhodobacteraceae bacterium]|nr:hypothetical protein [Paracoccaceae bacterium]